MLLYPHLPHPTCASLTELLRNASVEEAAGLAGHTHPGLVFTATGGTRVDGAKLSELRDLILGAARNSDYPNPAGEEARLRFDSAAAVVLHSVMEIPPGEATKPGVWEFMTCVLLPDVVRWRFPGTDGTTTADRFFAGRRNVFQRLWWRAHLLRDETADEPYSALEALGEDEQVQIMERPTLAAVTLLTRIVAAEFIAAADRYPELTPRRLLLREAQKRLLRLSAFVAFGALDEEEATRSVRRVFDAVAGSIEEEHQFAMRGSSARQHDA